jgi:hypothetical protein
MTKCSVAASALNLTTWLFGIMGLYIVLFNLVAYIVLGTPVYYFLRKKTLEIQTLAVWLTVNIISISTITCFFLMPSGEPGPHCISPFVLILPVAFILAGLLSVFPIVYFCRKTRKKMLTEH